MKLYFFIPFADASNYFDTQGPNFSHEPPSRIEFTNTAGNIADCIAHGNPPPNVEWLDKENNPITSISKVRQIILSTYIHHISTIYQEHHYDHHKLRIKTLSSLELSSE